MHDKFSRRIEAALAALGRPHRPFEETPRSGRGEPADRPHPAAEPARRRPLRNGAGAGWLPGRVSPACCLQRVIRRLGRALGGRLSAALEHRRLERSTALEGLYPAHPGRSRFPHPEGSARTCARSGISAPTASRRISWSAFSPSCCGRAWRCGSSAPVSEIRRAPCSKNSRAFSRTMSCLPTATHGQIRLRCVTQPDAAQAALLDRLGIVLPKRMRLDERELPALATQRLSPTPHKM